MRLSRQSQMLSGHIIDGDREGAVVDAVDVQF